MLQDFTMGYLKPSILDLKVGRGGGGEGRLICSIHLFDLDMSLLLTAPCP